MDPIEEKPVEEKPVLEDKTLEERVSVLEAKVAALEPKVTDVEDAVKPVRQILQVVVEKEGDVIKVRRKILVTIGGNSQEKWEDATEEIDQDIKEELLNGA